VSLIRDVDLVFQDQRLFSAGLRPASDVLVNERLYGSERRSRQRAAFRLGATFSSTSGLSARSDVLVNERLYGSERRSRQRTAVRLRDDGRLRGDGRLRDDGRHPATERVTATNERRTATDGFERRRRRRRRTSDDGDDGDERATDGDGRIMRSSGLRRRGRRLRDRS
jgi:hypothetical protein